MAWAFRLPVVSRVGIVLHKSILIQPPSKSLNKIRINKGIIASDGAVRPTKAPCVGAALEPLRW